MASTNPQESIAKSTGSREGGSSGAGGGGTTLLFSCLVFRQRVNQQYRTSSTDCSQTALRDVNEEQVFE